MLWFSHCYVFKGVTLFNQHKKKIQDISFITKFCTLSFEKLHSKTDCVLLYQQPNASQLGDI